MEQEVLLQHEASLFGRQTHRALCGLKGKLRLDSSARMNRTNRGKRSRALHCASLQTAAINLHYPPPTPLWQQMWWKLACILIDPQNIMFYTSLYSRRLNIYKYSQVCSCFDIISFFRLKTYTWIKVFPPNGKETKSDNNCEAIYEAGTIMVRAGEVSN